MSVLDIHLANAYRARSMKQGDAQTVNRLFAEALQADANLKKQAEDKLATIQAMAKRRADPDLRSDHISRVTRDALTDALNYVKEMA